MEFNDFYTLPKVAEKLDVNERWVRDRISDGSLKGYKVGRRLYVTHNDLVKLIENGKDGKNESDEVETKVTPTKKNKPKPKAK
jgi:hypothetical protein